ncbi:MAG: NADH:flavin oxidoreductase [Bacillota bacterium]
MPHLFSELDVAGVTMKNRIVMPPLANNMANEDGSVNDELIAHYVKRAHAEVGMIVVEHSYVCPTGKLTNRQLGIHNDSMIEGLRSLVDAVHEAGGKIGIQITHAGSATSSEVIGEQPMGPSPIIHPRGKGAPRELSAAELVRLAKEFATAAHRAKAAGFDMVEVHGAHGYLLSQFLSPLANQRTDQYGGSLENRLRFPLEVVRAVRQSVGDKYAVWYRLGADDRMPGGTTLEHGIYAAQELEKAGINVLDISGGMVGGRTDGPQGYYVPLSTAIKQAVQIPVMVTGGITAPSFADEVIRKEQADLVGIGRALLRDHEWAVKARAALGQGPQPAAHSPQ